MTELELHQMRTSLMRTYRGLIDESDLQRNSPTERDRAFLSRAVAATAIRRVTNLPHEECATAVIDGSRDNGIDAVAVTDASRVWLVQAKWKESGTAGFHTDAARAFVEGLHLLENRQFDLFNDRVRPFIPKLDAALRDMNLKITLVIAVVGNDPLHPDTEAILNRAADDHHGLGPMLDYRLLRANDLLQQLKDDRSPDPVELTARLPRWIKRDHPFTAYQGSVSADQVAEWYQQHGPRLFSENIRQSLGLTRINSGIQTTLAEEPDNFWYFNNGITILCDEIVDEYPGRRRPDEPVHLTLKHASIVNGAQTVTEIAKAMERDPETVQDADVSVKVISLGDERGTYAARITETTNTQNDVSQRDFIALDPVQARISDEFDFSLQKVYVYKRGEADPAPEAGCSVVHAATALACAHRTPELAVRAKKDTDLLWERGKAGAYHRLFAEQPGAFRIWHSVLIQWAVGKALDALRNDLHGRAKDVSMRGDLMITHLVFQLIDTDEIDEHDFDLAGVLASIPALTGSVHRWLVHHIDALFGTTSFLTSTFTNETKCRELARLVVRDVRTDSPVPELPENYQPPARLPRQRRRPHTVATLVNAGLLPAETRLTYVAGTVPEAEAVNPWLAENPQGAEATWQNDRSKPLRWAYDGQAYSANQLVLRIWELAGWERPPVSVQAPARWTPDGKRNLYEIARDWIDAQTDEEG